MSPPPSGVPRSVRKRDIAALVFVALGIAGLLSRLTRETPAEATPTVAARREYTPSLPARFTRARALAHAEDDSARDTRRLLRDFIIPLPGVKNLPASDALAVLRHHWESLPHAGDTVPPAPFSDRLPPDYASLPVSLEIPGISLLTNLRLLAAQTGLKLTLTDSGAALLPEENTEHRAPSRGEWPLTPATLSTYTGAAFRLRSRHDPEHYGPILTDSKILYPVLPAREVSEYSLTVDIAPTVIEFEDFADDDDSQDPAGETPEEAVPAEPVALSREEPVVVVVKGTLGSKDRKRYYPRESGEELEALFADMAIPVLPGQHDPPDESSTEADSPDEAADSEETQEPLPPMPADSPEDSIPSGWAWFRQDGRLSAVGDARVTRVAAEVATAVQEAAELGARIEIVAVEWPANNSPPPRPPDQLTYTTNPPSTRVGSGLVRCGGYDSVTFPAPPSRAYDLAIPLRDHLTLEIAAAGSCFQINSRVYLGERPTYTQENQTRGNIGGNMARFLGPVTVSPGVWTRLDIPSDQFSYSGREPRENPRPALERRPLEQGFFLRVSRAVVSRE